MKKLVAMTVCMIFMAAGASFAEEAGKGFITGRWVTPGTGPIADAKVSLFNERSGPPPSGGRSWRAPDETTGTDADGRFTTEVPAGNYYLGMTKYRQGNRPGPPQEGDLHHLSRDGKGNPKTYPVTAGKTTDIGVIADAAPFRREAVNTATAIEGTVTDETGKPAAGVLVFAYVNPEMSGKPRYVSERSGTDGKFLLVVDEGTYYLKIRSGYGGGQPEAGEMMGGYGEFGAPAAVVVKRGTVTGGIAIQGKRFPGRGKKE